MLDPMQLISEPVSTMPTIFDLKGEITVTSCLYSSTWALRQSIALRTAAAVSSSSMNSSSSLAVAAVSSQLEMQDFLLAFTVFGAG